MSELTFLTEEQVFGDSQLDILKKYGNICYITDFSVLLGGCVEPRWHDSHEGSEKYYNYTGSWWTRTKFHKKNFGNGYYVCVRTVGRDGVISVKDRMCGIRPVLSLSSIPENCINYGVNINGIKEIEYGEYPQTIVDDMFSCQLEKAYNKRGLRATGKSYTTDSIGVDDYNTSFRARTHIEYIYKRKKYIRFVGDSICDGKVLSDGKTIKKGTPYWIEVEPITWLVDEKANIALSKKIICSGVQFNAVNDFKDDFNASDIKKFMDVHLIKDIIPRFFYKLTLEKQAKMNKADNSQDKNIESVLKQAITELDGLSDANKDTVIEELQNILSQYKGNSNKEGINDIISKIKILISKLNSKSSNLVKAELEEIQRKFDESNKFVTEDGIRLTLYNEDYLIEELKRLQLKVEKMLEDKNNSDKGEEFLVQIDLLISSFASGNLSTMLNQLKTLGNLTDNIYQNYNNLSFSYQSEILKKLIQYITLMVGNHSIYSIYTIGIIEDYDKKYSDKIKLNENIVTLLISELESELRELELPEEVKGKYANAIINKNNMNSIPYLLSLSSVYSEYFDYKNRKQK